VTNVTTTTTIISKEQKLKLYNLWKGDIEAFVEDILAGDLTHKIPSFHSEMYSLLLKTLRIVLAAPRGFAKSKICSKFYPLHQSLFNLKKDICIISASENLAIEWLRQIRMEIESNQLIHHFFGDLRSPKWTETHLILNNKLKTSIRARGAGGQIRGFRPDLVILDDIETDESVASEDQRNKLRNWLFKACINTLLPHGQFIMIGTIISPLAILQEILSSDNSWDKRKYQAYREARQEPGYELWVDLWNHARLQARKKEIGSFAFASEYLNDPISSETAPIKPHQIRYWEELPQQYSCVIAVDPAYSEEERADYKVASLVGIDHNNNRYLISYIRNHKPSGEFIDGILNMYLQNKDKITAVGLPKGAGDTEFWNSVTRKAEERKIYPPFVELKNVFKDGDRVKRKKSERHIAALQPLFESGKYYIHSNHAEARDELLSIGASRWDDIVDTMTYAEQILTPGYTEPDLPARGRYGHPLPEEEPNYSYDYGYE
jgi:phage terminase large subunit-like protein